MTLEEATPSVYVRSLYGVLRTALGEKEDRVATVLEEALAAAGGVTLPSSPEELIVFAEVHLPAALQKELGPRLTAAVIYELCRVMRMHDAAATSAASSSAEASNGEDSERTSSSGQARLRVLIVSGDLLARATLARILVRAGYDVHAVAAEEIASQGQYGADVILVDLLPAEIETIYSRVATVFPAVPIVVRADSAKDLATQREPSAVIAREASTRHLLAALERALGERT